MFFTFPSGIMALFGLALSGWLVWQLICSAVKGLANDEEPVRSVELSATQSESGKSHVEKACYYPSLKSYYARVVCQELDHSLNVWADSKEELEHKVREEFDFCDERIRDRINKREARKPLYFRIR